MIRTCLLYEITSPSNSQQRLDANRFKSARLNEVIQNAKGATRLRAQSLADLIRQESLSPPRSGPHRLETILRCMYPAGHLVAAGPQMPPHVPVEVTIWMRRTSRWVVVFDAGRRLAWTAALLIAWATVGDPGVIQPVRIGSHRFEALETWLQDEDHPIPGHLTRAVLYGAHVGNTEYEQTLLSAPHLEVTDLYKKLRQTAKAIGYLTFVSPLFDGARRQLTCRLYRGGYLTVYGKNQTMTDVDLLLRELEGTIGLIQEDVVSKGDRPG